MAPGGSGQCPALAAGDRRPASPRHPKVPARCAQTARCAGQRLGSKLPAPQLQARRLVNAVRQADLGGLVPPASAQSARRAPVPSAPAPAQAGRCRSSASTPGDPGARLTRHAQCEARHVGGEGRGGQTARTGTGAGQRAGSSGPSQWRQVGASGQCRKPTAPVPCPTTPQRCPAARWRPSRPGDPGGPAPDRQTGTGKTRVITAPRSRVDCCRPGPGAAPDRGHHLHQQGRRRMRVSAPRRWSARAAGEPGDRHLPRAGRAHAARGRRPHGPSPVQHPRQRRRLGLMGRRRLDRQRRRAAGSGPSACGRTGPGRQGRSGGKDADESAPPPA